MGTTSFLEFAIVSLGVLVTIAALLLKSRR